MLFSVSLPAFSDNDIGSDNEIGGRVIESDAAYVGSPPPLEIPENYRPFPPLSSFAEVDLVTIYPGEALYSTFGHTAFRIRDPQLGIDLLYNYGQSSVPFDSGFVPNFVSGYLPFMLGVIKTERAYSFYRRHEDRSIYEQRLALSYGEKQRLYRFLSYNAMPENRIYIYDFFFDNCTTRVRDIFTFLYGKSLTYRLAPRTASYRDIIAPYLRAQPYVTLGINLMFGMPSDRTPPLKRRLFLPFQLMEAIENAEIAEEGASAKSRELESSSQIVYRQQRPDPEPPFVSPSVALWLFATLALLFSIMERGGRLAGAGIAALRFLDGIALALPGIIGIAILLLWSFSGYLMTTENLNLIWAWPTHLIAVFVGAGLSQRHVLLRLYHAAASAAGILFLLAIPVLPQSIPAGAIPLILTLVIRSAVRSGFLPEIRRRLKRLPTSRS